MPGTPYIVGITIEYPSGTSLADVNVTLRQNATNESKTLTTDSKGQVVFQLAKTKDFPSGYTLGDTLTAFIIYTGYEGDTSHTIVAGDGGGWSTTIVLTAKPSAPSLRYFSPQEFLNTMSMNLEEDDEENGVPLQQMVQIGESVEKEIDEDTGTVFDDNDGSYYSQTDYFDDTGDFREFTPTKRPIQSVTSLHYNTSRDGAADSWNVTSLTENTEYTLSPDTDKVRIARESSSMPDDNRRRGWRLIYTYGRSSVPNDIRLLAIYMTAVRMGFTAVVSSKIGGKSLSSEDFSAWFESYRIKITNRYCKRRFANT